MELYTCHLDLANTILSPPCCPRPLAAALPSVGARISHAPHAEPSLYKAEPDWTYSRTHTCSVFESGWVRVSRKLDIETTVDRTPNDVQIFGPEPRVGAIFRVFPSMLCTSRGRWVAGRLVGVPRALDTMRCASVCFFLRLTRRRSRTTVRTAGAATAETSTGKDQGCPRMAASEYSEEEGIGVGQMGVVSTKYLSPLQTSPGSSLFGARQR